MQTLCLRSTVVVGAFAALLGCAGYTPTINQDEKPTPQDAYLYGRFHMDAQQGGKWAFDGYQTMGFSITCANSRSYVVRFGKENPLQVIKIEPSTCSLKEFVYTDADGIVKSRKPAPAALMHNAEFAPGKAYYLGDFFAETRTIVSVGMVHRNWRITSMRHDYAKTTQEMKAAFPNLANIPTEDRMIGARASK